MLTYAVIAAAERMAMPVLFKEISTEMGLNTVAIGTIWGLDPLAGVFIGLPGGLLADRFGVKRTLTVVCLLAGLFSAFRGLSSNFITLAATTFLFGIVAAMTPSIAPKTTAIWFSRQYLGLTNALLQVGWGVGSMAATITSATILSPLLGGWRHVLFLWGAPAIVLGVLWLVTGREPAKHESPIDSVRSVPFRQALKEVVGIKEVWVMGLVALVFWGANMGLNGYLPLYLRNVGWTTVSADSAMTVLLGISMVGVVPMVLLANRLRSQQGMFFFSLIIMTISLAFIPVVGGSSSLWPLLIISGFLRSAFPALMNTLIFEIKGVGGTYAGTAIGLASSIGMAGACLAPPVGNSFAAFGPAMPFFFWAALSALALPAFMVFKRISQAQEEGSRISSLRAN